MTVKQLIGQLSCLPEDDDVKIVVPASSGTARAITSPASIVCEKDVVVITTTMVYNII